MEAVKQTLSLQPSALLGLKSNDVFIEVYQSRLTVSGEINKRQSVERNDGILFVSAAITCSREPLNFIAMKRVVLTRASSRQPLHCQCPVVGTFLSL